MWYAVISGLGIGLLGSFHCIGMCGPLALSLPLQGKTGAERLLRTVLYNTGRAFTYALLGLLLGFAGQQFFLLGYQQLLTILTGSVLLLALFAGLYRPGTQLLPAGLRARIGSVLGRLLRSAGSPASFFVVGMLNGLLPCGLVYLAAGSALATGNAWAGACLMFLFGMGTFPLMIAVMMLGAFIPLKMRAHLRRLVPVFACVAALIMIARGLNLGIPFLSPELRDQAHPLQRVLCHP
ncbi:MAG: sulfite exporter TauE/SafE family protein [Chitinophagaceae bacterium]|nr:sulfite exporter TauE/SafE family protein [Chitinophagaceae bacterium]